MTLTLAWKEMREHQGIWLTMVIMTVVVAMTIVSITTVMTAMKRHFVPVRVMAETVVADGMCAPICMTAFPFVEPRHPRPIQRQPHVAGAEIIIL